MDYKDTLYLPKSSFAMRGNLTQNEPKTYKIWYENNYAYKKMQKNRQNTQKTFVLHDGPPYANGHLHIGHALNKILKDAIVKTHYFFGEQVKYVPGWDCHGLPIEQQVEKDLGEKKKLLSKVKIRELCRKHARKFIEIQKKEFQSLGVLGDWENPYLTLDYEFEAKIYKTLCQIAQKGLLLERSKPVFWSWAAKSALAEAEVEYKDKEDYSIFVAFSLQEEANKALDAKNLKAIIWTTTPWTLPANTGIALNEDEIYVITSDDFIVAKKLHESLKQKGVINGEIIKEFNAKILENLKAINPLNQRNSTFILGSHVTTDGGSGLVHTAPGHGEDDYFVGLKYNLEILMPVDDEGKFDEQIIAKKLLPKEFLGVHVFSANEKILELLADSLLLQSKFTHSYPFCWRTHKPVIYRATKQWFIMMDEEKLSNESLRQKALNEIKKTKFYPPRGEKRLSSMIENRPDWCISRQRDWGVPIAFFRNKLTKEVIFDEDVLTYIYEVFRAKGTDAWWDQDITNLLNPKSKYKADELEKVTDILDVWFDSGSTWNCVLKSDNYDTKKYPADMYLEGSDQHRGWFQSSLLVSTSVQNIAPYKSILTHGFTVDEKGEKMSKSKGNVIAPIEIAKEFGIEILRLWIALSDYSGDLKISKNIIKQVGEHYRKIRNTFRFLLSSIDDLEVLSNIDELNELDLWILSRANLAFDEAKECFKRYDFSKGYSALMYFISVELSGIYLDICKDRLYCDDKESQIRRSSQTSIALITNSLLGLIAPFLTYSANEILEHAPKIIKKSYEDIFDFTYQELPTVQSKINHEHFINAREKFYEIVDNLKKEKIIKSTLELSIYTTSDEILNLNEVNRADWFSISKVSEYKNYQNEVNLGEFEVDGKKYIITKSTLQKCPRCWKFIAVDELCTRCHEVIEKIQNV